MKVRSEYLPVLRALVPEPVEIIGAGIEGQSTAKFLLGAGCERITIRDRDGSVSIPEGCDSRLGPDYLEGISSKSTVVRSAGVRTLSGELALFQENGGRIVSQLHIFLALFQGVRQGRAIGVTGTFGKGTVTTILSGMLAKAGIAHAVGGNIGIPMLDLLATDDLPALSVLELSSFQLSDLGCPTGFSGLPASVFSPRIGVCGRVTIEHLDWHQDQVEYWNAKARLCEEMTDSDHSVFLSDDPGSIFVGMAGSSIQVPVGEAGVFRPGTDAVLDPDGNTVLSRSEMRVPGAFQLANVSLAWAAARLAGADDKSCHDAAVEFEGLPHRLQFAGRRGGVRFFNDSYATRPEATLAAVEALSDGPLALILGGSDKGIDFSELAAGLRDIPNLRRICLIGATAGRLRRALEAAAPATFEVLDQPHLPEAFESCRQAVADGGVVLMSPACASFGLFRNYKERGVAFLGLVKALPEV